MKLTDLSKMAKWVYELSFNSKMYDVYVECASGRMSVKMYSTTTFGLAYTSYYHYTSDALTGDVLELSYSSSSNEISDFASATACLLNNLISLTSF